jgi:hypothetical protein
MRVAISISNIGLISSKSAKMTARSGESKGESKERGEGET